MKLNKQILFNCNSRLIKHFKYILNNVKKNCDAAEIIIKTLHGMKVSTRYGKIENIEFNNGSFFKIIIYKNSRMGSASSTNLNTKCIDDVIAAAIDIVKYTSADDNFGIAEKDLLANNPPDLKLYSNFDIDIKKATKMAKISEMSALKADKKIKKTEGSNFNSCYEIKVIGNTEDMLESYCASSHLLYTSVIAEEKNSMERDYFYSIARDPINLIDPETVGKKAAERVIARLSPRTLSTMKSPVVFISEVATSLFSHLAEAINGFNIYNKSSLLTNSLGKKIFPSWLTISENPHIISGLASAPFDEEGILTKPINIIKAGILKNFLLTNYSSRKLRLINNGHAGGIYNWYVLGQEISFSDLLKNMNNGLLITELMGNGVNITTGDYSRGASGFWVNNGIISFSVNKITISGNLKDMWSNIVLIGNDIEKRSSIQCGSLLISEMCISGT